MYVKLFEQILDSSIAENYKTRLVFEDMLLLADRHGIVDVTHEAFARRTNIPLDIVKMAITELEKPDARSRRADQDGRRITRLDEHRDWGWHIVNFEYYKNIRNDEDRTAYMRDYIKSYRANGKDKSRPVNNGKQRLARLANADADADAEAEADTEEDKRAPAARFVKPAAQEVTEYAKSKDIDLDGNIFCDYYESNGWKVGRNAMKSWKAAVTGTWKNGTGNKQQPATRKPFPGEIMKQLDELRMQRKKLYNRHEVNGTIPADRPQTRATHSALCDKIKQLEKELLAV